MPKYYCDYCKSYLTHDSTSVRKSHLVGKNHIKYVCDYYEREAKKLGIWDFEEYVKLTTLNDLYLGAPGAEKLHSSTDDAPETSSFYNSKNPKKDYYSKDSNNGRSGVTDADGKDSTSKDFSEVYTIVEKDIVIPPPPTLSYMPNPPPSVLRYSNNYIDKNLVALKTGAGIVTPDHHHGNEISSPAGASVSHGTTQRNYKSGNSKFSNYNNSSGASRGQSGNSYNSSGGSFGNSYDGGNKFQQYGRNQNYRDRKQGFQPYRTGQGQYNRNQQQGAGLQRSYGGGNSGAGGYRNNNSRGNYNNYNNYRQR